MPPSTASGSNKPKLSIVVPVYRSASCLAELAQQITRALSATGWEYEVILVNDFSPDESWEVIEKICAEDSRFVGVDLRRNVGQDNAILIGLRLAKGLSVAIMDDDLQHHPRYLPAMVAKLEQGADVVYAAFTNREHELWKRLGSWLHNLIAEWALYKPKDLYLSPYKVLRHNIVDGMCRYAGPMPYIDALILEITWKVESVPVEHFRRFSGESTYSFLRSVGVSARMLFSSTIKPLRALLWFGLIIQCLAVLGAAAALLVPDSVLLPGPANNRLSVLLFFARLAIGGIQLAGLAILGEYIRRSRRPGRTLKPRIRTVIRRAGRAEPPWPPTSIEDPEGVHCPR